MLSSAKSRYIRISPYKLRPFADVIRGYSVDKALAWLKTCGIKRARPIAKTLHSAYANAKNLHPDIESMDKVFIKEIRIDQGPIIKYFKPGAMGRASMQRKRLSHIEITLDQRLKA
jgi:large subunit ribosomal protein L22